MKLRELFVGFNLITWVLTASGAFSSKENVDKLAPFQTGTAVLKKYHTGGYSLIGVERLKQ